MLCREDTMPIKLLIDATYLLNEAKIHSNHQIYLQIEYMEGSIKPPISPEKILPRDSQPVFVRAP